MLKVLRINKYIQIDKGILKLDDKSVLCVSLDNTCAFEDIDDGGEIVLTDAQLDNLFSQTLGN